MGGITTVKSKQILLATAFGLACQIAGAGVAWAADAESAATVAEVVVTALKQSQSLQDVPAAVSAIDAEALTARGAAGVEAISQMVPNLNFGTHAGTSLVTIRGVGSTVDSGITEPTVAMYVDGVFLPRATMSTLRAVDLERVEVLRGPQGTLYGRNATGGAINFISAAPTRDFTGQVNLSTGSRSAYGVSGYASGALAEGVMFRLSGGREKQDGYVKVFPSGQKLDGTDVAYGRAALRLEPTSALTVELSARYEVADAANAYQQLLTPTVLPGAVQTTEVNRLDADQPFRMKAETLVLAGTATWKISDDISLKSVTSYVDHKSKVDFDADSTTYDGFNALAFSRPSESYAQELNLVGSAGPVSWLLGAYYYHEEASNALPLRLGAVFAPAFGVPINTVLTQSVASKTESVALFGDLTYSLSERLRLNVGLRYNHEEQDFTQLLVLNIPGVGVVPGEAAFAGGPLSVSDKSNKLLPKIGIQFDLTDDANLYAQWSRGFKSGGQNLEGGSGLSIGLKGLFKPETLDAYEIGLKSQWADRTVTANLAAFYYDYSNLQVTITLPPSTTIVQNADAKIYGVEGEFNWKVTDAFRLNAAATLTHARFDGFKSFDDARPAQGVQDLDGEPLPHAPDVTLSLGAEYRATLAGSPLPALTLRADGFYSDRVVLRYFGTANDSQKSYATLGLSAKLASEDGRTTLNAFLNNATNEHYLRNVTYIGAVGAFMGNYAPPRTWGVQISQKF
jgi:iron complex outermembrane receptor protein